MAVSNVASDIYWEEPDRLDRAPGTSLWIDRLAPLVREPGRWANLGVYADSTGALLKRGTLRTPPGQWEFTTRRRGLPKGRAYLFARYVGSD